MEQHPLAREVDLSLAQRWTELELLECKEIGKVLIKGRAFKPPQAVRTVLPVPLGQATSMRSLSSAFAALEKDEATKVEEITLSVVEKDASIVYYVIKKGVVSPVELRGLWEDGIASLLNVDLASQSSKMGVEDDMAQYDSAFKLAFQSDPQGNVYVFNDAGRRQFERGGPQFDWQRQIWHRLTCHWLKESYIVLIDETRRSAQLNWALPEYRITCHPFECIFGYIQSYLPRFAAQWQALQAFQPPAISIHVSRDGLYNPPGIWIKTAAGSAQSTQAIVLRPGKGSARFAHLSLPREPPSEYRWEEADVLAFLEHCCQEDRRVVEEDPRRYDAQLAASWASRTDIIDAIKSIKVANEEGPIHVAADAVPAFIQEVVQWLRRTGYEQGRQTPRTTGGSDAAPARFAPSPRSGRTASVMKE